MRRVTSGHEDGGKAIVRCCLHGEWGRVCRSAAAEAVLPAGPQEPATAGSEVEQVIRIRNVATDNAQDDPRLPAPSRLQGIQACTLDVLRVVVGLDVSR